MDMPDAKDTGSGRRKVLIVDDDPIMREVVTEQLREIACDCVPAEDGEAGRRISGTDHFDLAIIDITMPAMDGFELLRHLRQHPRTVDLPVIVCTSHNDRESIELAYQLGASSFVTKPINWPQFRHHVQFVMRNGDTERALRAARSEAQAASRLKNGLFHVLSHELKTPLSALVGLTGVLRDSLAAKAGDSEREQLDLIIDGARRLNGIIGDVLILSKALGKAEHRNFASVPIAELLDDVLAGHRFAAREKGVNLIVRPVEVEFSVPCDAHLIRQALTRLISNAIKFSPKGSSVEIWAQKRADGSVVLSVKDNGPGLSRAKLQDCLKPFVQDDMSYGRPAEGLGLGLPIAKSICEAHGGELVIHTAPGQGLLAAITLPAAEANADGVAA